MADEQAKKRPKRPTAQKRMLQNERRQLANKILKSKIKTYASRVEAAAQEEKATELNSLYKYVDKAVKTGLYKKNKGSRIKSRFAKTAATK